MTMTKTTAKKLAAAAAMCLTVGVVLAAGTGKFAKKPQIQGVQTGRHMLPSTVPAALQRQLLWCRTMCW